MNDDIDFVLRASQQHSKARGAVPCIFLFSGNFIYFTVLRYCYEGLVSVALNDFVVFAKMRKMNPK